MPTPDSAPGYIALDGQLCFSLYSASIAINRLYKPLLDRLGVTYPQYLVLSTLWEAEAGQTITAIADRLALEPSTITPLVKRLEQADFLARQRNPQDERQVFVSLTAKGKALRNDAGCLTNALLTQSGMTVEEIVSLNERVQQLLGALTSEGR